MVLGPYILSHADLGLKHFSKIFIHLFILFYQKDPISSFSVFLNKNKGKYQHVHSNYCARYKVKTELLKITTAKPFTINNVIHKQDLATKYLGIFVTPSDIENNNDND